jgi:DNA ligase-1
MKPLLAATIDDISLLRYPLLASPKLDGIRAVVIDGVLLSRNLKPIPNTFVQELFGKPEFNGMDGELICGDPCHPEAFRKTTSAVMSRDGNPIGIGFHVFDDFLLELPFHRRIEAVSPRAWGQVYPVEHTMVSDMGQLQSFEERCLGDGFEGVMLRDPQGPYKHGRSTLREGTLLKLKRFADDEAVVIAVEEQMQNTNELTRDALGRAERSNHKAGMVGKGTLGSLRVRGLTGPYAGVEYSVGSGMDDALRSALWERPPIGATVKVKYFPSGSKDAPRFPVLLGVRYD